MTLRTITCAECPRMIVRAEGETSYPLCAACLSRPGWVRDPLMRWLFEPSGKPEPIIEPEPAPPRPRRRRFGLVAFLAALIWSGVIGACGDRGGYGYECCGRLSPDARGEPVCCGQPLRAQCPECGAP